jgi:hypothetical protein
VEQLHEVVDAWALNPSMRRKSPLELEPRHFLNPKHFVARPFHVTRQDDSGEYSHRKLCEYDCDQDCITLAAAP